MLAQFLSHYLTVLDIKIIFSLMSNLDVPVGDGYKFMTFLDSCDLKQLVNQPTHLHGHILDLILSPSDQDTIVDVKICDFVSDHASLLTF